MPRKPGSGVCDLPVWYSQHPHIGSAHISQLMHRLPCANECNGCKGAGAGSGQHILDRKRTMRVPEMRQTAPDSATTHDVECF